MQTLRTREVRWFLGGTLPDPVWTRFEALGPPVEPESRADLYLVPAGDALGVKLREGRVEAKRRSAVLGPLAAATASRETGVVRATVEEWTKWSFARADDEEPSTGWVRVEKNRWQRRIEVGGGGATLEVSEVRVGDGVWGSVCLEAAGATDTIRRAAFVAGVQQWLGPGAPTLPADAAMGYPAWLRRVLN